MNAAPGEVFCPESVGASAHAEAAARFAVVFTAGLPVPKDLGVFILEALQRAAGAAERKRLRNEHILAAAALIGDGGAYTRARALAKLSNQAIKSAGADPSTAKGQLGFALRYASLPRTPRQFASILQGRSVLMEISPVDNSIPGGAKSKTPGGRLVLVRR